MSTRAGQFGSLPLRQAGYRNLRWVVIMAAAVVIAMFVVGGKSQVVRLGYRINDLEKQKRELERANRALTIEASSLAAPARVEEIAVTRFGMVRPAKENIVVVKRRQTAVPPPADAPESGRSAGER
jgi:cell division protein FtsL